jgi:hypothetical protein
MKVASKIDITLESSSVTASAKDEFDYTGSTTYNTGDEVKVSFEDDGTTARTPVVEYEALDDGITTDYPPDSPTKWSETATSNRYAMFDNYINSVTTDTKDIEVEVASSRANMVGLFGLVGSDVTFGWFDDLADIGGNVLYDDDGEKLLVGESETHVLKIPASTGWHSWLFDDYEYKTKMIWETNKRVGTTISVKITTAGGVASCGAMVLGNAKFLGNTRYNAKVGIDDYSVITTDSLDRLYLSQGNYSDHAEIEMWLENDTIDVVRRRLTALRGSLAIWELNNDGSDYDSLRIYGYYKTFDIIIPGPSISYCSLEIGGATS